MKILITGASGFIGRQLAKKLLALGQQVFILTRHQARVLDLAKQGAIITEADLLEPRSYKNIFSNDFEVIYHLAAISGRHWQISETDYYRYNVQATQDLLAMAFGKIKKFIYVSSLNAQSRNNFKNDPYGKSKYQAERVVLDYYERGLATIIIRPAIVYGPGDLKGVVFKMINLIKEKKFYPIGSGNNKLAFVYLDDLIDSLIKVLNSPASGQIYEIHGPDLVSVNKLLRLICENLGKKTPRLKIPVWLAYLSALIYEFFGLIWPHEPLITRQKVEALIKNFESLPEKARQELNYCPQVNFAEGLKKTIKWYKENNYLNI